MSDQPETAPQDGPEYIPERWVRWLDHGQHSLFVLIISLSIGLVVIVKGVALADEWHKADVDRQVAACVANEGYTTMPIINAPIPCDTKPHYYLFEGGADPLGPLTVILPPFLIIGMASFIFRAFMGATK